MTRLMFPILLAGMVSAAGAQSLRVEGGPPPPGPARIAQMQRREGDDVALLLGLREGQRPALDAFLASQRPPMPPGQGGEATPSQPAHADAGAAPPDFARQLGDRERMAAEHERRERAHLAAARAFWEQLDGRQQQLFDALLRLRHGGLETPGPHGPGGSWPGPHGPGRDGPPPPEPA